MNVFFTFDEYSDMSDEYETRGQADSMVDALRQPTKPRPAGEWIGGEITRQYVPSPCACPHNRRLM